MYWQKPEPLKTGFIIQVVADTEGEKGKISPLRMDEKIEKYDIFNQIFERVCEEKRNEGQQF